mgnify:CR=1 FL=1
MKNLIFLLLLICAPAFAEDVYIYTDYNPVRVLHVISGANPELEANKAGLAGTVKKIDSSGVPTDRSDRDFWEFKQGTIKVNPAKKKAHDDLEAKKIVDRASAKTKIGLTEDELKSIGIGD